MVVGSRSILQVCVGSGIIAILHFSPLRHATQEL